MLKCKVSKLAETIWPLVYVDTPVAVHGITGIGKTEIISGELMEMIRKEWPGAVLHDFRLSSKEPVDGTGIPKIVQDQDGNWVTIWTRPGFICRDDGKMHVYYLGEIGHSSVPMQHIAYQFTHERALGDYKLPRLNRVILDLNTREDKGGDNKLVPPLQNRMAHVLAELDHAGWIEHEKARGLDPRLIAFIKLRQKLLHDPNPNSPAFPTPRSIEELGKTMKAFPDNMTYIVNSAVANCGEGFGMQFETFLKDLGAALPKLSDVRANPAKAKVPADLHHQYLVASAISHEIKENDAKIWAVYLGRLEADIASMAANNAIQRDDKLKNCKELKDLII